MVKLIALYKPPADKAQFDDYYLQTHTPLARKLPGLRKLEIAKAYGAASGEARYHLVAEMYFDDQAALLAALKSPEGKAAGKDVMSFAGDLVHMMFAEVQ